MSRQQEEGMSLKDNLRNLMISTSVYSCWTRRRRRLAAMHWVEGGALTPPPQYVKECIIRDYARRFKLRTFVETGTFLAETVYALRNDFERLYSIEISPGLAAFSSRKMRPFKHVRILEGNSAEMPSPLMPGISGPVLFWLDAHYSGAKTAGENVPCPIFREVKTILDNARPGFVILIDDARLFNGTDGYPRLDELFQCLTPFSGKLDWHVHQDIIVIAPKA